MQMLRLITRNLNCCLKQSTKQLHNSCKVLSKDSASSSSDSSDSDSDNGKKTIRRQFEKITKDNVQNKTDSSDTSNRLNSLLESLVDIAKNKDTPIKKIDVAIQPKANRIKKIKAIHKKNSDFEKPLEEQLKGAAKEVAKTFKGDFRKTELELLSKVLNVNIKPENNDNEATEKESPSLKSLLHTMKVDRYTPEQSRSNVQTSKKILSYMKEPSVAESILYAKSQRKHKNHKKEKMVPELKGHHNPLNILINIPQKECSVNLSTWDKMEKRENELATMTYPQNVFQELIQWTNQGKIWNFPINNEQGMEEEEKVHFSEHIFLEHHLKGWCPKRGPIKHFMELVCVGLSKNHYMTIEEKKGHINWYKEYFEDKRGLLQELGALDDKSSENVTFDKKKQIEA
ncbi:hypothetical protein TKK_0010113 [Trichogramma kaykai]|uniref:Small ribosomal subunit protein mS31 n=1 Tax=Trichogramma kaykai TaxID=54128 RepID=A0ABD2WZ03_9HYME